MMTGIRTTFPLKVGISQLSGTNSFREYLGPNSKNKLWLRLKQKRNDNQFAESWIAYVGDSSESAQILVNAISASEVDDFPDDIVKLIDSISWNPELPLNWERLTAFSDSGLDSLKFASWTPSAQGPVFAFNRSGTLTDDGGLWVSLGYKKIPGKKLDLNFEEIRNILVDKGTVGPKEFPQKILSEIPAMSQRGADVHGQKKIETCVTIYAVADSYYYILEISDSSPYFDSVEHRRIIENFRGSVF
jgi:hypothetical protein